MSLRRSKSALSTRTWDPRWSAVLLVVCGACGGLSYQVDRDLLTEVSVENKLTLFDAENGVSIALDEREQTRREIQLLREDIESTERQIKEAREDEDRASDKGDAEREKVASMAEEVFELKKDYLEERVGLLRERISVQDVFVYVAFARYELAKARLVKKSNVRGAQDIDVEDFEEQVDEYVEQARERSVDFAEREEEVEQIRLAWSERREALQQASGGGLGSPWAEESALWGF
ncbi:MAG: hypothetical protein AAF735_06050 [Myxococcota bacterium]